MSESITPAAAEPGPTAGTSAGVAEVVTPAASSPVETIVEPVAAVVEPVVVEVTPEVVSPPVAETKTEERAPSLLSEAKPEEVKPEEKKPDEAKAEEKKAEEVKPEAKPPAAPVYEKFTMPEGVALADEKLTAFTSILGEHESRIAADPAQAHAVIQEMGQKMVDLYIKESQEQAERYTRLQKDNWDRTIESWRSEFREDPEIGNNRAETSLSRMANLLEMYGQKAGTDRLNKLRDVFTLTGAGNNPEVLRFVNWAASRLTETSRPVAAIGPRAPVTPRSRAERMYPSNRNSSGAA